VHGEDWLETIVSMKSNRNQYAKSVRRGYAKTTHQNRTSSVTRRVNSGETGGRRTWDASLCVGNPWLNQDHDERTHGEGIWKKNQTGGVRRECCLGSEMKMKGFGSNSEVKQLEDVGRDEKHAFG
jgi:hypothetical protein